MQFPHWSYATPIRWIGTANWIRSKQYSHTLFIFAPSPPLAGLWQGGPIHNPKTMPGRIVVAGYSFFILIVTATYTANLAAFLAGRHLAGRSRPVPAALPHWDLLVMRGQEGRTRLLLLLT